MSALQRDMLPQLAYWSQSPDLVAQRFYVAFCLLVSSVQDTFLGLRERHRENHNWSTTCSYYGMVHAGRLVTFLALGDFPTSHQQLCTLFRPATTDHSGQPPRVQLDWLGGFVRRTGGVPLEQLPNRPSLDEYRCLIAHYLQSLGIKQSRIDQYGRMLNAAKPLREGGNYEALLIAHERHHVTVTASFKELVAAMSEASEESMSFGQSAFSAFIAKDPDIESERDAFRTFLYDYLYSRMLGAIETKMDGLPHLVTRLRELANHIQPTRGASDYQHLENMVSLSIFEGKRCLMQKFQREVAALRQTLPHNAVI